MYHNVNILLLVFLPSVIKGINTPICPYPNGQHPAYFPHENCTKFWQCSYGIPYLMHCPQGLLFNPKLNFCDRSTNVICYEEYTEISSTTESSKDESSKCLLVDDAVSVYFPDEDCAKFWQCSNGKPYLYNCEEGLYFNPSLNICDWPSRALCKIPASSTREKSEMTTALFSEPSSTTRELPTSASESVTKNSVTPEEISYSTDHISDTSLSVTSESSQSTNEFSVTKSSTPVLTSDVMKDRTEESSLVTASNEIENGSTESNSEYITERKTEDFQPTDFSDDEDDDDDANPGSTIYNPSSDEAYSDLIAQVCENLPLDEFLAPHPLDCTKVLFCDHGSVTITSCPSGLWYDPLQRICDYPYQAHCESRPNEIYFLYQSKSTKSHEIISDLYAYNKLFFL